VFRGRRNTACAWFCRISASGFLLSFAPGLSLTDGSGRPVLLPGLAAGDLTRGRTPARLAFTFSCAGQNAQKGRSERAIVSRSPSGCSTGSLIIRATRKSPRFSASQFGW
jgi:hypothetical protein